jgi:hypothetical protein
MASGISQNGVIQKTMFKLPKEYRRDGRNAEVMPWIKRPGQTDYIEGLFELGLALISLVMKG